MPSDNLRSSAAALTDREIRTSKPYGPVGADAKPAGDATEIVNAQTIQPTNRTRTDMPRQVSQEQGSDLPAEGLFVELDGALDVVCGDFKVNDRVWHGGRRIADGREGWAGERDERDVRRIFICSRETCNPFYVNPQANRAASTVLQV